MKLEKPMRVERATSADIALLVEMRLAYLAEDFGPAFADDAERIERELPSYFSAHLNRDLFCYLAREGDVAAACAFLLAVEKPASPAFPNGRTGTVLNVYTKPAFRHRGFARAVMQTLLSDAAKKGICVIELKATKMGEGLYRSLGFEDASGEYRAMRWRG